MATYTTLAEAETAYLANADYAETASATKAKLFSAACRALLLLLPSRARQGDTETQYDPGTIRQEMSMAIQYANDAEGGGSLVDVSFEEFRS